jgi:uncharacterized protein YwqG
MFEKYLALAEPAVHLRATRTSRFTKIGGMPSLPPEIDWPHVNGRALPFLLQVDLEEICAAWPSFLPPKGALYFFFDDKRYGGGGTQDVEWWRVLYLPSLPMKAVDRQVVLGEDQIYKTRALKACRMDSLPCHYRFPGEFAADGALDAYVKLLLRPFGRSLEHHQMLGHASLLQESRPELECELRSRGLEGGSSTDQSILAASREWKLLCQIDTDEIAGWMWGDVGMIYFWIRESDARLGDFSRVWMTFECL